MRPYLLVALALLGPSPATAQDSPLRLPLAEMEFTDKKLGDTVRRLHATAEKMAARTWQRKPFEELGNASARGVYYAEWGSPHDGPEHPWNYTGPKELNFITLGAFFKPNQDDPGARLKILHTRLDAYWKPAGAGWSAKVEYQMKPGSADLFTCWWYHHQDPKKWQREESWKIDFHPTGQLFGGFSFGEKMEHTHYVVGVREKNWQKKTAQAMPIADVWKALASPETLRDYLVAEYTDQLNNIDDNSRPDRGLVVQTAYYELKAEGGKPVPLSQRPLRAEERTQILNAMKERVRGQITAVRGNYQALHAAAEKAFPLRKSLLGAKPE